MVRRVGFRKSGYRVSRPLRSLVSVWKPRGVIHFKRASVINSRVSIILRERERELLEEEIARFGKEKNFGRDFTRVWKISVLFNIYMYIYRRERFIIRIKRKELVLLDRRALVAAQR